MKLNLAGSRERGALRVVAFLAAALALAPRPADEFRRPLPPWIQSEKGEQVFIDQGRFDPRLKGILTPEGIKVEIVADYPTVVNPVAMTFADDGTPLVLEWLPGDAREQAEEIAYKDGTKRKIATVRKERKEGDKTVVAMDVLKALRSTKNDGVYDEAKVVLQDELPSSVLVHDGWTYLSGRGTVRRVRPSKAGGAYDVKEVIARGFGGVGRRQVSGLTLGNDGWLYITSGEGDHYVEGSDGSRATVLRTGAVFRCRPDGSKLHAFSVGYRNPYRDLAFDAAFNAFHVDSENAERGKDGDCRLMHVAEESDFSPSAGELPALLKTGRGVPTGLHIYNDTRFPEPYRGLLYYPDTSRQSIRAYHVVKAGATFSVKQSFEVMASDDGLFRPCQVVTGPDGAIYVVDWRTDHGGAGQLAGDGKHGRVYRLRWSGTADQPALPLRGMDSWAKVRALPDGDLVQALSRPDFSDRQMAGRELAQRGAKQRDALLALLDDSDAPAVARLGAAGALQSCWNDDVRGAFIEQLRAGDPDLRRLVADGLALKCEPGDTVAGAALVKALSDQDVAARRAIALAIGRIGGDGQADALVHALQFDEERDPMLRDGLVRAIERLGKKGIDRLLTLAESGNDRDRRLALDVFVTLRSREAAAALPGLLTYPHDLSSQRLSLIKSYGNYRLDPPLDVKPMLDHVAGKKRLTTPERIAGLQALAALDLPVARDTATAFLDEKDLMLQEAGVAVLVAEAAGAKLVAERFVAKKLPRELRTQVANGLREHVAKHPELQKLLDEVK